jgi:hypothetical protein
VKNGTVTAFTRIISMTRTSCRNPMLWVTVGAAMLCAACASKYALVRASIPTAYGSSHTLRVGVDAPNGWRTPGPVRDGIAFQPANCQHPGCPIINAVLYVGDSYDPIPTQADSAKTWWTKIDPTVVAKSEGSFHTNTHGSLTIYHFSSSNTEEQLIVFIIHNHETVAVTLSGVPNGDFHRCLEALEQVAASVQFQN